MEPALTSRLRRLARIPTFALCATAALLTACGGGGGSGGITPVPLASAPGDAAIGGYYTTAHNGTLSATTSAGSFTFQYTLAPTSGTTTFEGNVVSGSTQTATLTSNTGTQTTAVGTEYFTTAPFHLYGSVSGTSQVYTVYGTPTPLPTTVSVGQSGQLGSGIHYRDSTKAVVDGIVTNSWTAQADSATTLLLCLTSVDSGTTPAGTADGVGDSTEVDCFHVDAAGTATLASITITANGTSVTFR